MIKLVHRMTQRLKSAVAFVVFYSGLLRLLNVFVNRFEPIAMDRRPRFPFLKPRRSRDFQILAYHRVGDTDDLALPSIPTAVFKKQMEYLAAHVRVCSLQDVIVQGLRNGVPENAVVITFDDGYRDNYLNAFPVLTDLSLTATVFLVTDSIGSGKSLWHDRVFRAFGRTEESDREDLPLRVESGIEQSGG